MTVSTAPTPLSYAGNGSTTAFPITWKYNATTHVVATLRSSAGVETVWVVTTNYTITAAGDSGTLTAVVAPATGTTLVITLEPPNTQSSDIPIGGDFPSVTVEDGLDLAAQRDGKIESLFLRALRVPKTDTQTGSLLELPIDSLRASKFLSFDANGKPIAAAGTSANLGPVSTFIDTLLDDTTAAVARTTLAALGSDLTALTSETEPDSADVLALGDVSAGTTDKVTVSVLAEAIRSLIVDKSGAGMASNYSLAAVPNAGALTITMSGYDGTALSSTNKSQFTYRSATAATGTTSALTVTANATLVISSGSTHGATSGVPFRLWILGINDGGTFRLGSKLCATSTNSFSLSDDSIVSSTAEGGAGAADTAGFIYTGTAVTSKAMRVLGYFEFSLTTAGTWDEVPDKVQLWQPGMKLPGDVVQSARTGFSAMTTGATVVPSDDTVPQNTEGDEYMTQAITPVSACNVIKITALGNYSSSAINSIIQCIFQDTTASALKTSGSNAPAGRFMSIDTSHRMIASTTASTTFKARAGGTDAGTTTSNGTAGAARFGGTYSSFMEVSELMA